MNTPTLPTLHSNGTGKKMLADGYDRAHEKLDDFVDAWRAIEFNARDYYPQGNTAWEAALEEREAISAKIRDVHKYIEAIRVHIYS